MPVKKLQVYLRGGLGNQLFQYSTGRSLARFHGHQLILRDDLLPITDDSVGGISRWSNQIIGFNHLGIVLRRENQPFQKTNTFGKSMQLMRFIGDVSPKLMARAGYLASENSLINSHLISKRIRLINSYAPLKELAHDQRNELRAEISGIRNPSGDFLSLKASIRKEPTLCVHFRQGDYVQLSHVFGTLGKDYFEKAMSKMESAFSAKRVWLFTDSHIVPDFLSAVIGHHKVIGPETLASAIEVLNLLSSGVGIIGSNSTFSWWASFIATEETKVIAPLSSRAKFNCFSGALDFAQDNWELLRVDS